MIQTPEEITGGLFPCFSEAGHSYTRETDPGHLPPPSPLTHLKVTPLNCG